MSKKIDFTSLPMKDIEGNVFEENVAPFIGNFIFKMAENVVDHELGIKIYHSDGAIDIDEKELASIKKFLPTWNYNIQLAVEDILFS